MRRHTSTVILTSLLALIGCAPKHSPRWLESQTPEVLAPYSDDQIARAYEAFAFDRYFWGADQPKLRADLERRGVFTKEEWAAIDEHRVFPGMSSRAVMCALGPPVDMTSAVRGTTIVVSTKHTRPSHPTTWVTCVDDRVTDVRQYVPR